MVISMKKDRITFIQLHWFNIPLAKSKLVNGIDEGTRLTISYLSALFKKTNNVNEQRLRRSTKLIFGYWI